MKATEIISAYNKASKEDKRKIEIAIFNRLAPIYSTLKDDDKEQVRKLAKRIGAEDVLISHMLKNNFHENSN